MSKKAAERGTKRACQACGSRFYDLNSDPITCPACQAVFQAAPSARSEVAAMADKVLKKPPKKPEFVIEDKVAEVSEIPADVVVDEVAEEGAATPAEGEPETFLEQEEEDADVTGFIEGGIEEPGAEEV